VESKKIMRWRNMQFGLEYTGPIMGGKKTERVFEGDGGIALDGCCVLRYAVFSEQ
jgi:hypothetical protein